jgi:exonuclease SbcD
MIRLLHFADLHLGVENYGRIDPQTGLFSRLTDFLHSLNQIIDHALEQEMDLVLFAGDAYKSRDPSPTYQREFAKRIQRLSAAGIPTILVVGNHDTPNALGRANAVEIFDTLEVENVVVAKRPATHRLETKSGPIQVVTLPWVVRSTLLAREEYKNLNLEEVNALILEKVENIIAEEIGGLDPAVPAVLAAHGSVFGATYGSERSVMLGQEVILPRSMVTNPTFDYVALGHIHKHQVISEEPPVVYAGSIERIDFGEEKEDKGFVVAEVEKGRATYEFVKLAARPFITVEVEARGDDPTAEVLAAIDEHNIAEAVVRVIIHTTPDREPLIRENEIRRRLADAFHVAAMVRDVERKTRLRLGTDQNVEEMTPRQMLERYLEVKQTPPERAQVLLEYADRIIES